MNLLGNGWAFITQLFNRYFRVFAANNKRLAFTVFLRRQGGTARRLLKYPEKSTKIPNLNGSNMSASPSKKIITANPWGQEKQAHWQSPLAWLTFLDIARIQKRNNFLDHETDPKGAIKQKKDYAPQCFLNANHLGAPHEMFQF
jgi:hypothetical protein